MAVGGRGCPLASNEGEEGPATVTSVPSAFADGRHPSLPAARTAEGALSALPPETEPSERLDDSDREQAQPAGWGAPLSGGSGVEPGTLGIQSDDLSRLGSVNAVIKISTGSHAWDQK